MTVNVYGKLDGSCGLCEAAKDKLMKMEIPFKSFELSDMVAYHDGWRDDESVEVLACYSDIDTFPVITIDGKAMSYPEAMRKLKRLKPSKRTPVVVDFAEAVSIPEEELVAVG